MKFLGILLAFAKFFLSTHSWPDGAPCIHSILDSMNPLEAVEHQGGLQLSDPPFRIVVEGRCYDTTRAVEFTLEGVNDRHKFKGFAVQPIVFQGPKAGQKSGQFVRLDDNGSWQYQCFRRRDSITHSHDEKKARMKMWWRGDSSTDVVQFVATVVVSLRKFWVKSVLSSPIPPCRMPQDFSTWTHPTPTPPPPTGHFKMDAFTFFNGRSANIIENSIVNVQDTPNKRPVLRSELAPPPTALTLPTTTFQTTTISIFLPATTMPPRRINHIIPLNNMDLNLRTTSTPQTCRDIDTPQNCFVWIRLCVTSTYMRQRCRRTCQFC